MRETREMREMREMRGAGGTGGARSLAQRSQSDSEFDTENGVESPERRGRSEWRGGYLGGGWGGRGGRDSSRGYSVDSVSHYSDSTQSLKDCYASPNHQSTDSELSTLAQPAGGSSVMGRMGRILYNPERRWGSWMGL